MKRHRRFRSQAKRLYFSRPKPKEGEFDFIKNFWIPMLQLKLAAARKRLMSLKDKKITD